MRVKARSRRYPTQTIMNIEYANDIELLANTLTQAKSLLHSLERAAGDIGLHLNADKTEYMSINQTGNISTLNCGSLKLVDKYTYFRSDINMWLAKIWTAIDKLSVILKSGLTDKIKCSFFFQALIMSYCYMNAPSGHWLSIQRKSLAAITQECYELYWTSPRGNILQNSSCTATDHPSWKPSKLD